jgi:hypothetical protein
MALEAQLERWKVTQQNRLQSAKHAVDAHVALNPPQMDKKEDGISNDRPGGRLDA